MQRNLMLGLHEDARSDAIGSRTLRRRPVIGYPLWTLRSARANTTLFQRVESEFPTKTSMSE